MTIFYLEIDNDIYALDSTESIQKSLKGKLSQALVEDGNYSSDNYVNEPITFNFSGVVTDVKKLQDDFQKTPKEYLDKINSAFTGKKSVEVYYSDIQLPEDSCYFTSFTHTQSLQHGSNGGHNSFEVSFSLQKVRYAAGARITSRPSEAVARSVQEKTEKGTTTKTPSDRVNDDIVDAQKNISQGGQLISRGFNGS